MHKLGISDVVMMFAGAGVSMARYPPLWLRRQEIHTFGETRWHVIKRQVMQKFARVARLNCIISNGANPVQRKTARILSWMPANSPIPSCIMPRDTHREMSQGQT